MAFVVCQTGLGKDMRGPFKTPFFTTAVIIDCVEDIFGELYWCTRTRPTKHGFDVYLGFTEDHPKRISCVVLTRELADHMRKHNFRWRAADLPVSPTTLGRLRRMMNVESPWDRVVVERKKREAPKPRFVKDVDGVMFRITRSYDCELGVSVHQGVPVDAFPSSQIILTPPLAALIREWSSAPGALRKLLSIDWHVLCTFRHRLGLSWYEEQELWWADRLHELLTLSPTEFAQKYERSKGAVSVKKGAVRRVIRILQAPDDHAEFIKLLKVDCKADAQAIQKQFGGKKNYYYMRPYRQAYNMLEAAGVLDEINDIKFKLFERFKPDSKQLDIFRSKKGRTDERHAKHSPA